MRNHSQRLILAAGLAAFLLLGPTVKGEEIPKEYRPTIEKGLAWLVKNQYKDGHWEGAGSQYKVSMTALGGMALLAEGSTIREGKYSDNIRRATTWMMDRVQPNGLIGNPSNQAESGRYMYGHGFGLLFLSSIVGEEETSRRREKLVKLLEAAAKYTRDAQTNRGGWGYVSAKDGSNFDEGSVTITQVQGLRACRNAGIVVPAEAIKNAQKYLKDSTTSDGGIMYSLAWGGGGGGSGRPALTAAAVCCGFSFGDYDSDLVKKWLKNIKSTIYDKMDSGGRIGHDEYTHYYMAQTMYVLGEDRYTKLFPTARKDEALKWSVYRTKLFKGWKSTQSSDGSWSHDSWTARMVGPVYVTACYLAVMQLDKGALPIYQR